MTQTFEKSCGIREEDMETKRTHRIYDWVGRHIRLVAAALVLVVIGLGVIGPVVANSDEPNFDPGGEMFEVAERAEATLRSESTISQATFITEAADGGDVLTADAFREWSAAERRVLASETNAEHLAERYDAGTGASIPGVLSIVDVVEGALPNGLADATDAEVKQALAAVFADDAPYAEMAFSLSEQAVVTEGPDGPVWVAPAFTTQVAYDDATFAEYTDGEIWLRDLQAEFRDGAEHTTSIGIAIDGDSTFAEATQKSAPFIFLAVALIIILIAVVHRSYWSAVVVAAGLAASTLAAYGTSALVGLKMGSLLLAFIVPIAMISFGVDFYIHAVGRVREAEVDDGLAPKRAYPAGMAAVFTALLLAVSSSIAAFMANAASGTEAIIEFGIGSAIALGWAYLILGQVAPRVLIGIEDFVGPNPMKRFSRVFYAAAMVIVAIVGGLAVALAAVMPAIGVAAFAIVLVALIGIPALLTRRRNHRALVQGRTLHLEYRGSAHGLRSAGSVVHGLAKWRVITIPVVLMIGAAGLFAALQVNSGFELTDFLSSDTDMVKSIELAREHFPTGGEGSSFVYVEGDLTNPDALVVLDEAVARLDASGAEMGRNPDGSLVVGLHAADLVRMTMASPDAVAGIETSGVSLADGDGNGLPDTAAGVRGIYDHIVAAGVPAPDGRVAVTAAAVPGILADDGGTVQSTAIVIQVGSFTDGAVVVPVRDALADAANELERTTIGLDASESGDVLTQYYGMESFTNSMLVSVPLAILLTLILAMVMLRSFRYAIVSVIPIAFVVVGVYAFMAIAGYTVNVVTATIAAIAVGVGIDFSTHFTARFREEVNGDSHRLDAVRRAGAGTGGALVLSAVTSVLGFTVMALAPTPIFATFGTLTAVMIGLALVVSLVVLPSLLVFVAPRPKPIPATDFALDAEVPVTAS
jgi:predicted RND superfamily exporter protein